MTTSPSSAAPLLARLKTDTRQAHVRAEHALNLMDPALSAAHYADVLSWLHARHARLEPTLEALLSADLTGEERAALDLASRRKAPLLAADLTALGRTVGPTGPPPAWLRCEADAWGAAYVLEGATLGGQLVIRHLRRLKFSEDALRYYGSYGAEVGARWRTFGHLLSARHARDPHPALFAARAVEAATRTFADLTFPAATGLAAPESA
ncbi:biliverdin-producing heme oxygenase [Deinococcus radiotolerans]|uniref:Heme oxygenase n=1 Tax=Deinococcus radiotolerans TaxID=1309407 RepID=A0ABQ2FI65_9DEIO|nr:biliverdin-producing heme oxygenase [Deinococcus radiotolerans]GGL00674.1 heme oxygenase [Deinococcus radiotolerans]